MEELLNLTSVSDGNLSDVAEGNVTCSDQVTLRLQLQGRKARKLQVYCKSGRRPKGIALIEINEPDPD